MILFCLALSLLTLHGSWDLFCSLFILYSASIFLTYYLSSLWVDPCQSFSHYSHWSCSPSLNICVVVLLVYMVLLCIPSHDQLLFYYHGLVNYILSTRVEVHNLLGEEWVNRHQISPSCIIQNPLILSFLLPAYFSPCYLSKAQLTFSPKRRLDQSILIPLLLRIW